MKKKLIIFIPSIEDGGVEKNLFTITNYLNKKIESVEVLTCNKNFSNKFDKGVKLIGPNNIFWQKRNKLIKYSISLIILFYRLIKDKDKTLIFSFQANIYAIIISKILDKKIITRSNTSPSGWSKNIVKIYLYNFFLKLADEIMVNSNSFKKEYLNKFNIQTRCIFNPFDKNFVNKKLKNKKDIKFFGKKKLNLVSVGRLTEQKDHLTLLKSMKLIDTKFCPRLIIVGKGKKIKELKNFIKDNNLTNIVKLVGYKENPYPYIKKSDIVILTSKYEGLPNILIEAQYLKKYIISTNCPTGPKEILLAGLAGDLIKIGDYKKLANLINNYYKNRNKIKKKINMGIKNFSRFDYQINCKKYLNFVVNNF